ncbi:GlxA family transcriptional regulator [Deminuibacter soli]|uniref:Helix-turn-helix domain-containing protein n=1 Tax=Deminuibacter soli TaxID=2291815 RepID=A0A3E1NH47_9BACT|nr:helix-turn-helix domain-containing protein [Deminuibacter soli]RFM27269.1 helix-turn-helix domain-containing protein [Deminuibacter soli]
MKHVTILALHDAAINCVDSCFQILTRVNDFLRYQGKASFYEVTIAGLQKTTSLNNGLYTIHTTAGIHGIAHTDVIVIPITCGHFPESVKRNAQFIDWVRAMYKNGTEIVSLCVGSFFLAATGLLHHKECAVHWAARNEFSAMFPDVRVIDDRLITDADGIYTCGGAYSYLNLLLYIIEKHLNREMAVLASKMFEIDMDRSSQHPFVIFLGQKHHADKNVLEAQQYIEQHYEQKLTVEAICAKAGMGRRTFERRFKKLTGNSIVEYIQRVKVEAVKKQLEQGRKTINEIVYEVGYNDINAFRDVFKRCTGLSPLEYRRKFGV